MGLRRLIERLFRQRRETPPPIVHSCFEIDYQAHLRMVVEALTLLAGSFEAQMHELIEFGHFEGRSDIGEIDRRWNIDELGLRLEHAALLAGGLAEQGDLTAEQQAGIEEIDAFLASLSSRVDPAFWTVGALETDQRWQWVREAAGRALASIAAGSPANSG